MQDTETHFMKDATDSSYRDCVAKRRRYDLLLLDNTKEKDLCTSQKIFDWGNKTGRLLPYFTKPEFNPTGVPSLLTPVGETITAHEDIHGLI